ncbi:MAG: cysteine hydrolase [Deltaproteobacteria bacterium]|nr:cysteine hydrolase [Deltaproteobacteria bacterium]MBW2070462.1 cysteine hydrolase [Deltaproteobacteria bacterium]
MARKALIVVDMLNDFVDPKGALYCGEPARRIIPFIAKLIDSHRSRGDVVIYLQDTHSEDDKEFEIFPPHSIDGSWGHEIIPELAPRPGDIVVQKRRYSGFFQTPLEDILEDHHITEVVVTGVCTSICVMDTVGGLRNRDYPVKVFRDGVADFDERMHQFSLERMAKIYKAEVL